MILKKANPYKKLTLKTWMLSLYLILTPLDFIPILPKVSINKFLVFIPIMGCLPYLKQLRIRISRYLLLPIMFVLVVMVSLLYSFNQAESIPRMISIGLNIGVIILFGSFLYNQTEIMFIKKAIMISGWFTLILMLIYADRNIMNERMTIAISGAYQDPNYLVGYLIFTIMYYYSNLISKGIKKAILPITIFLVFVAYTGSRSGLISVIGAIIFYTVVWIKDNKIRLAPVLKVLSLVLLVFSALIFVINVLPESIEERYEIAFSISDKLAGRIYIWESIINSYRQSPLFNKLFGWGAGTIRNFSYMGKVAHNIWLESLIEIGLVGVLVQFIFYFTFYKKAYKQRDYVIVSSFIGYMIMAMALSMYSYKPIWNVIMLIYILYNNENRFNPEESFYLKDSDLYLEN